jgi:iron complex transport system permease protein
MAPPESPAVLAERPMWPVIALGGAAVIAAMLFGLHWGSTAYGLTDALRGDDRIAAEIIRQRWPQVLLAALVGAVLAVAGMLFQALLRNPLASPFTLGVAGGGALGAFLVLRFGSAAWVGGSVTLSLASAKAGGAFIGVLVTVALVFVLARAAGGVQTVTLLLAGVTLNFICAAGVMLLQLLSDFAQTMRMVRWSMGGFEYAADQLGLTAGLIAVGMAITLPALRHLDVLSVGDTEARLLGVPLGRVRAQILLGTAIMVGACLAAAGPIGFVGLIVPHTCRLLVGPSHRRLLPATALGGAALLVFADAVGRGLPFHLKGYTGEIPVGVLTAALGGPFFLMLLLVLGRSGRIAN